MQNSEADSRFSQPSKNVVQVAANPGDDVWLANCYFAHNYVASAYLVDFRAVRSFGEPQPTTPQLPSSNSICYRMTRQFPDAPPEARASGLATARKATNDCSYAKARGLNHLTQSHRILLILEPAAVLANHTFLPCCPYHPGGMSRRIGQPAPCHVAFVRRQKTRLPDLIFFEATSGSLSVRPGDAHHP